MLKYTVQSDGTFIVFSGIDNTDKEGIFEAHQKSLVKEVIEDIPKSALLLIDPDDNSSEYIFYEVQNPVTGFAFTSLTSFRLYVLTALNSISYDSNLFIDNWDAINNVPVLADGGLYDSDDDTTPDATAPNAYYFIVVNADDIPANNTTIDGENNWGVGDVVRSTGTKWVRQPRVTQVSAFNVSYVNNVLEVDDPAWFSIDEVQSAIDTLYTRVATFAGTLASLTDVDFDTAAPVNGDGLIYDEDESKWVPGKTSGRDLYEVINRVDGVIGAEPTVDGNYLLTTGNSVGWLPGAPVPDVGDILNLDSTAWTILVDSSTKSAGEIEILFTTSPYDGSNYVWDGTSWEAFDAYEPNAALNSITVSNTTLGDISSPPYGAPAFTGSTLRGRSISKILDDIIFQTNPATYVAPYIRASYVSNTSNTIDIERGGDLSLPLRATYTKQDGGNLDSLSPTYIGGGVELEMNITIDSVLYSNTQDTQVVGNRVLEINTIGVKAPATASNAPAGVLTVTARTDEGAPKPDNKGNDTPGNISARTLVDTQNYYSRYPIWVGHVTDPFKVAESELTTISINPNAGTNVAGTLLDNAWLQGAGVSLKKLFVSNYTQSTLISPSNGDKHLLIICPPGISVSLIESEALNVWSAMDAQTYRDFDIAGITALDGSSPKTYKCYYSRDISSGTFTARNIRFTTTGTITP